jgi:hypothetical protein
LQAWQPLVLDPSTVNIPTLPYKYARFVFYNLMTK